MFDPPSQILVQNSQLWEYKKDHNIKVWFLLDLEDNEEKKESHYKKMISFLQFNIIISRVVNKFNMRVLFLKDIWYGYNGVIDLKWWGDFKVFI